MSGSLSIVLDRARRSEFYASRLMQNSDGSNWDNIALTTKSDLRSQYPFGLLATSKSELVSYHESSGTEGIPVSSYFSKNDWQDIAERFSRSAIGLNANDTFFIKTPYSMVTTAHQAQRAAELAGALIIPADNRSTNMPLSRVVQLLRDLKVTVTWSLPTEVIFWALAANALGMDPKTDFPQLRAFWVAGEILSPGKKQLIESLWGGKKVYEDYGSTETGSLAGECKEGRLHAWSDRVLLEVLDSNSGKLNAFGQGQLVVTPLYREAMPLVRYNTEDEVILSACGCSCGSKLPLIEVLGRSTNQFSVGGMRLSTREIEHVVCEAGLPYGLALFRVAYDQQGLEIDIFSLESSFSCATAVYQAVSLRWGVEVIVNPKELESFVPSDLFQEKLKFSKPQFFREKVGSLTSSLIYY